MVEAEGLYTKALYFDAQHTEALIRRAKALPLVEEIDNQMLAEIHRKRETFLQVALIHCLTAINCYQPPADPPLGPGPQASHA